MIVRCPSCAQWLRYPRNLANPVLRCRACDHSFHASAAVPVSDDELRDAGESIEAPFEAANAPPHPTRGHAPQQATVPPGPIRGQHVATATPVAAAAYGGPYVQVGPGAHVGPGQQFSPGAPVGPGQYVAPGTPVVTAAPVNVYVGRPWRYQTSSRGARKAMIVMTIAGAGMLFLMLMIFGMSGVFSPHPVLPEIQRSRSRIQFSPLPGGKMPSPQVQERLNRELSDHFVQQRLHDIIERKLNPPPPTAPASPAPPTVPRAPTFELPPES